MIKQQNMTKSRSGDKSMPMIDADSCRWMQKKVPELSIGWC